MLILFIFSGELNLKNQAKAMTFTSSGGKAFIVNLMNSELAIVYNSENRTFQLISKNADFMKLVKEYFHEKIALNSQEVKVSADALKEYSVSLLLIEFFTYLFKVIIFLYHLFQNVDNLLSAVNWASETRKKEIILLIANARQMNLLISNN